jgi:hypothetical protein|tara:strand:- start:390 stop:581 length:192 start_codon:yes stop_codon:yes gene_type:complete
MNKLAYLEDTSVSTDQKTLDALHGGENTELFTTGSIACKTSMASGGGTELFTTGSQPVTLSTV